MTETSDALAGLKMPLVDAIETQRSIRRLSSEPIDDEIVLKLIELGTKAPTGSNFQNWEFIVVKDAAIKARLRRLYEQAWRIYGAAGRRIRRGDDATIRNMAAVEWQIEHFEEIPVILVPCLKGSRIPLLPMPGLLATTYYGSIYPSIQNILLGARAIGLGAGIVTLPLWNTFAIRKLLSLPCTVMPCALIPLGWPLGRYGPTTRRPAQEVAHLDRYGNRPWNEPR